MKINPNKKKQIKKKEKKKQIIQKNKSKNKPHFTPFHS
jgi:hypothetical protein